MSVACIIIAHARRRDLVRERVLPSAISQPFNEIVVVADYAADLPVNGFRWLVVEALTATTIDALVKRDVGTLATTADWLLYLSDDHAIRQIPTRYPPGLPLVGIPTRFCWRDGERVPLNSGLEGQNAPYCGGHAGLFSRSLVQRRPWSSTPHHRLWDVLSTQLFVQDGATLLGPLEDFVIEDLEPERSPWR